MRIFFETRLKDEEFRVWQKSFYGVNCMAHWHREVELMYVRNGRILACVNNVEYYMETGDLLICDSGDIHYCTSDDEKTLTTFILVNPDIIGKIFNKEHCLSPVIKSADIDKYNFRDEVEHLFSTVRSELISQPQYFNYVIKSEFGRFWSLLLRKVPSKSFDVKDNGRRMTNLLNLQKLFDYIDQTSEIDISLETAASIMHFSIWHFSKMFKRLTGLNFVSYVNSIRIEKAAQMLTSTDKTITEIALDSGFSNVRTFNRAFSKSLGVTPSKMIDDHKENKSMSLYNKPHLALTSCASEFE